ncbi:hypothetical protein [Roseivirga sp.]
MEYRENRSGIFQHCRIASVWKHLHERLTIRQFARYTPAGIVRRRVWSS